MTNSRRFIVVFFDVLCVFEPKDEVGRKNFKKKNCAPNHDLHLRLLFVIDRICEVEEVESTRTVEQRVPGSTNLFLTPAGTLRSIPSLSFSHLVLEEAGERTEVRRTAVTSTGTSIEKVLVVRGKRCKVTELVH
jgi:hypothetical protein